MKPKSLGGLLLIAVLASTLSTLSLAQAPAAAPKKPAAAHPAAPPPDDINPGFDTSADDHQVRDTTPSSSAAASRSAEAASAPAAAPAKPKASGTKKAAPGEKPADKPADKPAAKGQERLDLDRTQITGNRELPKVMVIVPWKRADLGDVGRPMNSLLDEVLQPIDRDVFQRQTRYYDALKPDSAAVAPGGAGR